MSTSLMSGMDRLSAESEADCQHLHECVDHHQIAPVLIGLLVCSKVRQRCQLMPYGLKSSIALDDSALGVQSASPVEQHGCL